MFKGWGTTRGVTDPANLPAEARAYLDALMDSVQVPLTYLSTGPDRAEGYVVPGTVLEPLLGGLSG